jgi:hypothetical protein
MANGACRHLDRITVTDRSAEPGETWGWCFVDDRPGTVDTSGPAGTAGRIVVGGVLVGSVVWGHARSGPDVWAWLIGLAVLPTLTIIRQRCAPVAIRSAWCG